MKRAQRDLSKDVRITAEDACKVAPRQTVLSLRNSVFAMTGFEREGLRSSTGDMALYTSQSGLAGGCDIIEAQRLW